METAGGKWGADWPSRLRVPLSSTAGMIAYSLACSFFVLIVALLLQVLVYDDWLHDTGPIRVIGTTVASLVTFGFVLHWQKGLRRQQEEAYRRFAVIAEANDRIRNQLQAIEFLLYRAEQASTKELAAAVDLIDDALHGLIAEARPSPKSSCKEPVTAVKSQRSSA